jgi:hypothetical protein
MMAAGVTGTAPMVQKTECLIDEISRISRIIARLERKTRDERRVWAATLQDLRAERRILHRVIRIRRAEAARKIVDFRRWRDGS